MKILLVGGGGREHAFAWRLKKSRSVTDIVASPGNPGIAQLATCIPAPSKLEDYVSIAQANDVDLTVVGPEAPLVAGIVDSFRNQGLAIIGPPRAAARLEGSKIFAKHFFQRANIPTARYVTTSSYSDAVSKMKQFNFPVAVKADGLQAGKGVIIALDEAEAFTAIRKLGPELVLEEFLRGEEVSFIGVANGDRFVPFCPSQDHKRLYDNDEGPNTGGMGAYADERILNEKQRGQIMEQIIHPTLRQLQEDGTPYTGFLYAGLMMTADGPKILEYNVRMGDPETQAIMHAFNGDLAELLVAVNTGASTIPEFQTRGASVCVTIAARNYPDGPQTGDLITGIDKAEATGATVFQAGTKFVDGQLVTSGGRVLGVTASADRLIDAIDNAYLAAEKINFEGMHYRSDIGQKGLRRW